VTQGHFIQHQGTDTFFAGSFVAGYDHQPVDHGRQAKTGAGRLVALVAYVEVFGNSQFLLQGHQRRFINEITKIRCIGAGGEFELANFGAWLGCFRLFHQCSLGRLKIRQGRNCRHPGLLKGVLVLL
jgi:hypothetical protein